MKVIKLEHQEKKKRGGGGSESVTVSGFAVLCVLWKFRRGLESFDGTGNQINDIH